MRKHFSFAPRGSVPFSGVPSADKSKVIVVGSLSMDQVCRVEALPHKDSLVTAKEFHVTRGGRGANQAVAAARQGVEVALIGSVGDDQAGRDYLEFLATDEKINVDGVSLSPSVPTGTSFITMEEKGNSRMTVVAPGANAGVTRDKIQGQRKLIESGSALLVQFDVPAAAISEALHLANRKNIPIIVNPSPMNPLFPWEETPIDHVIVNEREASELFDCRLDLIDHEFIRSHIYELRIQNLIITRRSQTTLVYDREGDFFEVEPLPALPIDASGAGDAFVGCFAARIAEGSSVEDAVRAANCAGALTTLGIGAQRAMPDRERVEQHLEQIPKRRKMLRRLS